MIEDRGKGSEARGRERSALETTPTRAVKHAPLNPDP